ncbi:MAG: Tfp pilus assembly protein PilX [Oleispira sp.]|jgi:Tfp pilus assembly protein PilX
MNYSAMKQQSGSVLAISLVLLTAITVLAVMSMERAGLQTRITSNILHRELLFNSTMNEQESWFFLIKTADTGDSMLSAPIRSFDLDIDGNRIYTPVQLDVNNTMPNNIAMTNQLIVLGTTAGINALAEGQETGDRVMYHYQLQSQTGIAGRVGGRTMSESQITGMSFPGLNTSKNSLYSAP